MISLDIVLRSAGPLGREMHAIPDRLTDSEAKPMTAFEVYGQ